MSDFDELLAQFRGIPSKYRREPRDRTKSISDSIDSLVKKYQIEAPRTELLIVQNWREIVGPRNAHRCKPNRLTSEKELIITTTNSTLRMELQFDRKRILANLQRVCGKDAITGLTVR